MATILVTGGGGYIGSHTCVELLNSNHCVISVDNYCNSSKESLNRVEMITGKKIISYCGDIRNPDILRKIFRENKIDAVIHFAGLKSVKESVLNPLEYYDNNVCGTINLCEIMKEFLVKNLVFSSSATVYNSDLTSPFNEEMPVGKVSSPYGRTKYVIEEILRDLKNSDIEWSISILRYFNPVGAHESGLIGEDPLGIPNNLMPFVSKVALGIFPYLTVFSKDYNTRDGTCIRDYIHVMDLARGHLLALEKILSENGIEVYNLGSGMGYSVLEFIDAFEKICESKINYKIGEKRQGDLPIVYADTTKAREELGFKVIYDIKKMCVDTLNWQRKNPSGYSNTR
ncbi:MAG: UDP-glucose 4-epimerase GalE [Oscillospiraceae bacterium]|nr:UDP-glucose 4-epimerase GalE [Oscillospiraceae bacterium]